MENNRNNQQMAQSPKSNTNDSRDYMEKTIPNYLRDTINDARNMRYAAFANSINVLDFFLYGNVNAVAPADAFFYGNSGFSNGGTPVRCTIYKTDSTIEHISAGSASSYMAALLPKGLNSISVEIKPTNPTLKTNVDEAKELSLEVTRQFREYLKHGVKTLEAGINRVVRDYVDYGNCVCLLLDNRTTIKHIPFKNSYFLTPHKSATFFFVYDEYLQRHQVYGHDDKSPKIIQLRHVFTNDAGYLEEGDYLIQDGVIELIIDVARDRIIKIIPHEYNPVFIARNHTMAGLNQANNHVSNSDPLAGGPIAGTSYQYINWNVPHIYGRGAGIQAISSIINANYAIQMLNLGSALSVHPATIGAKGVTLNQNSEEVFQNYLVVQPGFYNTIDDAISQPTNDNRSRMFDIISHPEQILGSFAENYSLHLKQIETSYNTEIFSVAAVNNQTATEIIQRQEQAARQFRGMASPFYNELLLPLLSSLYESFANLTNIGDKRFTINIFSYEDEQTREINAVKAEKYFQSLVSIASAGIPVDGLEKKLAKAIELMEEFYLSKDM